MFDNRALVLVVFWTSRHQWVCERAEKRNETAYSCTLSFNETKDSQVSDKLKAKRYHQNLPKRGIFGAMVYLDIACMASKR